MTSEQKSFPLAGSKFAFQQYGHRAWLSELMPHTSKVVDDLCFIKTMYTEAINHDPALTFFQTGAQVGNRPSMGAWLSYGLDSENKNLPAFCCVCFPKERQQPGGLFQIVDRTVSWIPGTRACSSATVKTRCCTSTTRKPSTMPTGGGCSIGWPD